MNDEKFYTIFYLGGIVVVVYVTAVLEVSGSNL